MSLRDQPSLETSKLQPLSWTQHHRAASQTGPGLFRLQLPAVASSANGTAVHGGKPPRFSSHRKETAMWYLRLSLTLLAITILAVSAAWAQGTILPQPCAD